MAYDPVAYGARCGLCPLQARRDGHPVPPEIRPSSICLAVGEAPGEMEVALGAPFVGPSGNELILTLNTIALDRSHVSLSNACLCRPPGNDMAKVLSDIKKENKLRDKQGAPLLPTPQQCCRPRLVRELLQFQNLLALGGQGYQAIIGDPEASIMAARGFPDRVDLHRTSGQGFDFGEDATLVPPDYVRRRVFATFHPAFVLRQRRWTKIFRSDITRAFRYFRDEHRWVEPRVIYTPTPAQVEEFLFGRRFPWWAFDTETDAKESLVAKLRCIGVANNEEAIVVPFLGIDGQSRFYTLEDQERIKEFFRRFFTDRTRLKIAHNFYYDCIVIEQNLGVRPVPALDTILGHRGMDGELPHGLGFVGSYVTEPPRAWKKDHTAVDAKSDFELWEYNGIDTVVTSRIVEPIFAACEVRGQNRVLEVDHKIQTYCIGMHRLGMHVDQARRAERDKELLYGKVLHDGTVAEKGIVHYDKILKLAAGREDFNASSPLQVGELIFRKWGIKPEDFTDTGAESTSDGVLLKLLARKGLSALQKEGLHALRWFRKKVKERGTYVGKLVRCDQFIANDGFMFDADEAERLAEEEEIAADTRRRERRRLKQGVVQDKFDRRIRDARRGVVLLDGRVHPGWNAHVAVTGRLSSSDPINAQNFPKHLRDMITAEDGNLLIGSDMDQLEFRFVVALARAARYLEIFDKIYRKRKAGKKIDKLDPNEDPYSMVAAAIFTKEWVVASEESKDKLRTFAKIFTLASLYGAEAQTKWDILRSSEDKKGRLVYLDLTLRQVRERHDAWCEANPDIVRWWDEVWFEYRRLGCLYEPVLGRRRDFLDGDEEVRNEVLNFKAQSGGAGLVHLATIKIIENMIPFFKWGPNTGLIQQGHDALVFEVPESKAEKLAPEVEEAMECRAPGLDIVFTASAKVGRRWSEV